MKQKRGQAETPKQREVKDKQRLMEFNLAVEKAIQRTAEQDR